MSKKKKLKKAEKLRAMVQAPELIPTKNSKKQSRVTVDAVISSGRGSVPALAREQIYVLPEPYPGVVPADALMAMDDAFSPSMEYAYSSMYSEGLGFMGYPYLAELTQRPEYRRPSEIIAKEMTRKWLTIICTGEEDDKSDQIKKIEKEFKRLHVKDLFMKAAEQDGFFGRSEIFIDTGITKDNELQKPLKASKTKIGIGGIKRLKLIEPYWTYPSTYNSTNPLAQDFFKPIQWFVMGTQVHTSRFLHFVSREVSDILKPIYCFGGLSLSQMCKPYIDNWLRSRQSVSDILHSFSVSVLKTNMDSVLEGGGGDSLLNRVQIFNRYRDNRGVFVVDKDTEDFTNVSAPLGTLDHLQSQAQEHMSSVAGIPLIVLLKITPSGLNASSEGELRTFYDWIEAQQEAIFSPNIEALLNFVQLSLFGEIDPEISFKWNPLWTLDELSMATKRKTEADTDVELINAGIIDNIEARTRLANEDESPYAGLDLSKEIEAPGQEPPPGQETFGREGEEGEDPFGGGDQPGGGGQKAPIVPGSTAPAEKNESNTLKKPQPGMDGEFKEGDHKRDEAGKFTVGEGGSGTLADKNGDQYDVAHTIWNNKHRYQVNSKEGRRAHVIEMSGVHPDQVMWMGAEPEFQRKGLNSVLHDYIEKHQGIEIKPTWATTEEGNSFYKARAKKKNELGQDGEKWITVHPNGPDADGRPALIDGESGTVIGGMGGKFTGKKIGEVHKGGGTEKSGGKGTVKVTPVTPPPPQRSLELNLNQK